MAWKSDANPILIGGDGRSGTTLLSVILDSHSQIAVGAELHFRGPVNLGPYVLDAIHRKRAGEFALTKRGEQDHPEWVPARRFLARCTRIGITEEELEPLILEAAQETSSELALFHDRCALIERLGQTLARHAGKSRWGLKIMREIRRVGEYAEAWPQAQFIHIIRDGRDVAASQMKEHASWGYTSIEQAADGWSKIVLQVKELEKQFRIAVVRYEDIIVSPESALKSLMRSIGLDWEDTLLRHTEFRHALIESGRHHPSHSQISRPINDAAFGRYRRDLTPEQISYFNDAARPALELMGYPIE